MGHLLSFNYRDIGAIYAFGSPKVGDPTWSKSYPDWLSQKTFRVAHHTDFVSGLPAGAQNWAHVGHVLAPEGPSGNVTEPHSVVSYFTSLVPAHSAALGEQVDRISMKSQNILQGISYRETIQLKNFRVDDYDDDSDFSIADSYETAKRDQNSRYELPPSSNIVRVTPGSRLPKSPAAQRAVPLGRLVDPLVAPDLIQQIRNNVFVLVSNMKNLHGILFHGSEGDFNAILGTVIGPMKNLMIITKVITSHNDFVKELVRSMEYFLQIADKFFLRVGDKTAPLEEVDEAWLAVLPAAKVVGKNCERVSGRI